MAITDNLSKLRLELGDTDPENYVFNDDELGYFLAAEDDDITRARLRACEAAALRFARAYDFSTDGQSFSRSQQAQAYAEMAKQLRSLGVTTSSDVAGVTTVAVTVVDGYSSDIPNDETVAATSAAGRRYDPWGDDDVIP